MKKILFITSSSIGGGAQKHIRDMFLQFVGKGYEMHLVAPRGWLTEELSPYKENIYELLVSVKNLPTLVKIFDKIKPDVTNTFILSGGIFGYTAWLRKKYGKIFITVNNPIIYDGISPVNKIIYPTFYRFMAKRCNAFLVKSDNVKDEVNNTTGKGNAISIKNGIDFSVFDKNMKGSLKRELGLSNSDILITNTGALEERKGQKYLIEAMKTICEKYENAYCAIAGEGSIEKELSELISVFGLDNKVFLLGKRRDVNNILASTDVFVLSSLHEGLPNSLIEAMSMQKPCVATDAGGASELIDTEISGFIINSKSADEILEKVLWFLKNKEQATVMAEKAYIKIKENYELSSVAKELLKIYEEL